jgi:hypothetical protein
MKRSLLTGFSFILVLALLLTATGAAIAAPLADAPVVTLLAGSGTITTKPISVEDLPGTIVNEAGTILPAGFPEGEKQFSGDGIQVSGLNGMANACMPMANYQYGWFGSIYQYVNGKWTALPGTTTPIAESSAATVCATIYSDGIYAVLVSYKPPANGTQDKECTMRMKGGVFGSNDVEGFVDLYGVLLMSDFNVNHFPVGAKFKYKVINENPAVTLGGDLTGYITVVGAEGDEDGSFVEFTFSEDTFVTYSGEGSPEFSVRVYLPGCYADFNFYVDA